MAQSLGFQIVAEVPGDQGRATIGYQSRPVLTLYLVDTGCLTSRLDDLTEVACCHGWLQPPGQDLAVEVVQYRD